MAIFTSYVKLPEGNYGTWPTDNLRIDMGVVSTNDRILSSGLEFRPIHPDWSA